MILTAKWRKKHRHSGFATAIRALWIHTASRCLPGVWCRRAPLSSSHISSQPHGPLPLCLLPSCPSYLGEIWARWISLASLTLPFPVSDTCPPLHMLGLVSSPTTSLFSFIILVKSTTFPKTHIGVSCFISGFTVLHDLPAIWPMSYLVNTYFHSPHFGMSAPGQQEVLSAFLTDMSLIYRRYFWKNEHISEWMKEYTWVMTLVIWEIHLFSHKTNR